MSKSSNKNYKVVDRRTKTQLVKELAEAQKALRNQEIELISCGKEMQSAKLELKRLQEQQKKVQSDDYDLNGDKNLLAENEKLKDKLRKIDESSAIQLEATDEKLRKLEQQNQKLEKQVLSFRKQLEDAKKKIPTEDDQDEIFLKNFATSKSTFLIHFYPQQGSFHGRIEHLLTRDKKAFSGLDSEAAFEFISKHLPIVDDRNKISEPAAGAEVLKELKFLQLKRFHNLEDNLQANRPFALFTNLHFPVMPTEINLDIDASNYEVLVLMTDAKKKKVVARSGVANVLSPKVANYENKINMPAIAPGKYWLRICARAPFANIEESKEIQINFQS